MAPDHRPAWCPSYVVSLFLEGREVPPARSSEPRRAVPCGHDGCRYWREPTRSGYAPCPLHDGYACGCTYLDGRPKPGCERCSGSGRWFPHPQMIGAGYMGPGGNPAGAGG